MTYVKICGCKTVEQALTAAEAGADFIGLVFAQSRRRVTAGEASEIVRALGAPLGAVEMQSPPSMFRTEAVDLRSWYEHGATALERLLARKRPLTVGVFANNDPTEINEIIEECGVDLIQLAGGEDWSACLAANRQVVKVLHVRHDDTPATALGRVEAGGATALLLDRADPAAYGGTGQVFDWSVAAGIGQTLPFWLAGGLTPETVAEAIATANPWAVDVSSGVETDGKKDIEKVRAFIRAAKGR
jgi:phosphoribosylanthranilate isomerase